MTKTRKSEVLLLLFSSLVLLALQPKLGSAGDPEKIIVVSPAWEQYTHEDGMGLYFELMRRVYGAHGMKVETRIVPWARGKAMILNDQADCMLAAYLTPQDDRWAYPKHPIDVDYAAAVFLRENVRRWNGLETLAGKSVVWLRGYNFQNYMDLEVRWMEIDAEQQGWEMVKQGRADFYMDILPEIESYIEKQEIDLDRYGYETVFMIKTYVRFGANQKSEYLKRIYDLEIERMLSTGELKALYQKWTGSFPEFAFDKNNLRKIERNDRTIH